MKENAFLTLFKPTTVRVKNLNFPLKIIEKREEMFKL